MGRAVVWASRPAYSPNGSLIEQPTRRSRPTCTFRARATPFGQVQGSAASLPVRHADRLPSVTILPLDTRRALRRSKGSPAGIRAPARRRRRGDCPARSPRPPRRSGRQGMAQILDPSADMAVGQRVGARSSGGDRRGTGGGMAFIGAGCIARPRWPRPSRRIRRGAATGDGATGGIGHRGRSERTKKPASNMAGGGRSGLVAIRAGSKWAGIWPLGQGRIRAGRHGRDHPAARWSGRWL